MLVALNIQLRRGRRLRLLLTTLLLCLTLLAAHGAVGGAHMASAGSAGAMEAIGHVMPAAGTAGIASGPGDALMAMCLAIAQTAALAFGALALAHLLAALLLFCRVSWWSTPTPVRVPWPALAQRARPPDLAVLQVLRR